MSIIKSERAYAKEQAICVAVSQFLGYLQKCHRFDSLPLIEHDPQNELRDVTYFIQ